MLRKRKQPTPNFKLPPPYQPITGERAPLVVKGVFPYVAMMQIAEEDTHCDYVICRGFDIRYAKFIDYEYGNPDKPGIEVAKPYGRRYRGTYRIGEIHPAILPLQTSNPSPTTADWRTGQNPGVAAVSQGHPADLAESVEHLWDDEDEHLLNWMLIGDEQRPAAMVRAAECIKPGEGGTAIVQQWNTTTECWEDATESTIDIIDPMGWLMAVTGDCFKVDFGSPQCDGTTPPPSSSYMPSFPFGMTQLVRVNTKIDCGDCGEVTVVRKVDDGSGHCQTEETECTFQACNMSYRPISCDGQEYAIAHIIPGQCCLPDIVEGSEGPEERCVAFLMPYPRPMLAKGKLGEKMCGGAATLSEVSFLDVCRWDGSTPTAASNPTNLHACDGTDVLLVWGLEAGECAWFVSQVGDVELSDYMIDIRCKSGECATEKKTNLYSYYGHFCDCEDQEEVWDDAGLVGRYVEIITGGEATESGGDATNFLSGASCVEDGCGLTFTTTGIKPMSLTLKTKKLCVFCQKDELEDGEDVPVSGLFGLGEPGGAVTIFGTQIDVITGLTLNTESTSEDGGDPVDDCEAAGGEKLVLTGTTNRICVLCPTEEGVFGVEGEPVALGLKFSAVTAATNMDFSCDPCPAFAWDKTSFYALCVGEEEASIEGVAECECAPCEEESA